MNLDFRPDFPPGPGVLSTASSVIPDKFGQYRTSFAATGITAWGSAIGATSTGARVVRKADGTPFLFVGTGTNIFEYTAVGVSNVSLVVGGYTAGVDWWFCQLGDETLACNYNNTTQTRSGASATAFANHATAPKAKIMIALSGHVLALNYNDGTAVPNGIKWASQGSSATWIASASNSAGSAKLIETPGEITAGATIHDIAVVWKRGSMYVGKRVQTDEIWKFNALSPTIGCPWKEGWVSTPVGLIFLSANGVFKFDGSTPVPIDRGVRADIYASIGSSAYLSHDEVSGCVFLWLAGTVAWTYNYLSDKWSKGYNGSIGLAATSMSRPVRDSLVDDVVAINGVAVPSVQRRCHLVTGSDQIMYNLASTVPANGLSPTLTLQNVRHPDCDPREETLIRRVIPVWGSSVEQIYSEPSTGSLQHFTKTRQSASPSLAKTTSLDAVKCFDSEVAANTHYLSMAFTNESLVLAGLEFDWAKSGKR